MAANILSGMVPLSLSFFLLFSLGSRADEAAVYDDLPSFMDIRIERLSGDARHLKDLLDQGKLGDFYQQALPVLNRELFDEDGGMTPEELENALFINNMVVKAPYQDYRLDNFSIWINGVSWKPNLKHVVIFPKFKPMSGRTRGSGKGRSSRGSAWRRSSNISGG